MKNLEAQKEALRLIMWALRNINDEQIEKAKRAATLICIKMIEQSDNNIGKIDFWNYVTKSIREDF